MTLFDLLFIALFFAACAALIAAAVALRRRQHARALSVLKNLGIYASAYLAIVAIVGFLSPQRVLKIGDPWCFDDWCLSVEKVNRAAGPSRVEYTVSLRIFSRALRAYQRAKGAWVAVIDSSGNRYAPEPGPYSVPLDMLLQPGESVTTSRTFKLPLNAAGLGLITGHGCCVADFIIGDEASLLHKPTLVRF